MATVLPETYEEAMIEQVAVAVAIVEGKLKGGGREWLETALRNRLRRGLTDRQKVIDAAEAGDDLSHAVLMAEFHSMLDGGQMPPASLRAYAARAEGHPKRGRGRVWYGDWRRNWGFMILMALSAERFNLEPTRNRATDAPCGASLVAAALKRRGFKGVSESRLVNLWGSMGDAVIDGIALYRVWPELIPHI